MTQPFAKPNFPQTVIDAAKAAAVAAYPKESCGLIVNNAYVPCVNVAKDPTADFEIDETAVKAAGSNLQGVLHSHPDEDAVPSSDDMQGQIDTAVIWGIIAVIKDVTDKIVARDPVFWGDYRLEEPLIGRQFIHGISDCGSIIRSYFWQTKQIKINDFPRNDQWWKDGDNIYLDKFKTAGFIQIQQQELITGDVFLGKVRSPVPNHGGIILNAAAGLGLHHLENRLSRREPILPWSKFITHYLRYTG